MKFIFFLEKQSSVSYLFTEFVKALHYRYAFRENFQMERKLLLRGSQVYQCKVLQNLGPRLC